MPHKIARLTLPQHVQQSCRFVQWNSRAFLVLDPFYCFRVRAITSAGRSHDDFSASGKSVRNILTPKGKDAMLCTMPSGSCWKLHVEILSKIMIFGI